MFVDEVQIELSAGDGGKGMATFRREKYVPHGGPNGGDGGHGGSIVLKADHNLTTLLDFRYQKKYHAQRGEDGSKKDMFGKNGSDLILKAPIGTVVTNLETGELVADLNRDGQTVVLAKGGIGGRGNAHFATSTHQAPKFAELGEPGEQFQLQLELKLLADVGLIGFPNVGKSTLISSVSAARPKIAPYPFTTLVPHLGVIRVDVERNFVMADIPGIIEGASEGAGLGHQFLRHISRARILVHILDVGGVSGRNPIDDFDIINHELEAYNPNLLLLPQFVALNKIDMISDSESLDPLETLLLSRGYPVYRISAATHAGLPHLVFDLMLKLESIREQDYKNNPPPSDEMVIFKASKEIDSHWEAVKRSEGLFEVTGKDIERRVAMTDVKNEEALRRLQKHMDRIGITNMLKSLGAKHGNTVIIRATEFDYQDEDQMYCELGDRIENRTRRK